jgi:ABC-type multidrug transport system ATPase subunit
LSATWDEVPLATGGHPPGHALVTGRPFIEARSVTKRYRSGVLANAAIDFDAELGDVIAIVGPNGAGKTSFVMQLIGLLEPTEGAIRIGDVDVVGDPDGAKWLIGYQPQGHMAMGGLEVGHVLQFTARLRGMSKADAVCQAAALAAEFDLDSVLSKPLNQLSGGWRRLVDVAVAFAGSPRLVVLDEPTDNLDPIHRGLIWQKLNGLRRSRAATCLLVTHNLLEAERVVDRVVMIDQGRVVEAGTPGALKQRFGNELLLDVYLRIDEPGAEIASGLTRLGAVLHVRPGHVQIRLEQDAVAEAMKLLLCDAARSWLDDFRLAPPSLEAVYLGLGEEIAHARPAA